MERNLNDRYQVEEVIFAGYKADGNRKYLPNTVENAVKVMKQDGKNASVGSASFSHFVASILKPMGTLDQIRKKKGNLTGNYEDVEKFQENGNQSMMSWLIRCNLMQNHLKAMAWTDWKKLPHRRIQRNMPRMSMVWT